MKHPKLPLTTPGYPSRAMSKSTTTRKGTANKSAPSQHQATLKPPLHPHWVLFIAAVLPGMGQVVNNTPMRGLIMVSFMIMLGLLTYHLADPAVSIVGKLAGGIFIYALSLMDAYYWAKYRSELFKRSAQPDGNPE